MFVYFNVEKIMNPLFNSSFFYTPESWVEFQNYIETTYHGAERATAYQIMMMTQNLCHKLVEERLTETV